MKPVYLLSTAWALNSWNQMGYHHPNFLFHEPLLFITATAESPTLQDLTSSQTIVKNVMTLSW